MVQSRTHAATTVTSTVKNSAAFWIILVFVTVSFPRSYLSASGIIMCICGLRIAETRSPRYSN